MARYEVVYYPGEPDERLPEWQVVEWTNLASPIGVKSGKIIWKSYDMEFGERDAKDIAYHLQEVYNWEFAQEYA